MKVVQKPLRTDGPSTTTPLTSDTSDLGVLLSPGARSSNWNASLRTGDETVTPWVLRREGEWKTSGSGGTLEPIDPDTMFATLDDVSFGLHENWSGTHQFGDYGSVGANAEVLAGGDVDFDYDISADGASATVSGEVGVKTAASIDGSFDLTGVQLAGQLSDVKGEVKGEVEAGAYAEGKTTVDAGFVPPRIGAEAEGSTFAGAKAKAEAKVQLNEAVTVEGEAGAWAGAGAEGKAGVKLNGTTLEVTAKGGAAWGYGAGAGGTVKVDLLKAAQLGLKNAFDPSRLVRMSPAGRMLSTAVTALAA